MPTKKRNYKREYENYQGTEEQKKNRAKRNAARRKAARKGKVAKEQCQLQLDIASKVAKANPKREYSHETHNDELRKRIHDFAYQRCYDVAKQGLADKHK